MNQEIKAKWVAALRSGEYKQAQGKLNTGNGMCCLGVLCDLHAKETGGQWKEDDYDTKCYLGANGWLPHEVMEWAGLENIQGDYVEIEGHSARLSSHNDGFHGGKIGDEHRTSANFKQIAKAIEDQL